MEDKILIVKNDDCILISNNGKKLVIDKDNLLFNQLKDKSKEDIQKWFIERK